VLLGRDHLWGSRGRCGAARSTPHRRSAASALGRRHVDPGRSSAAWGTWSRGRLNQRDRDKTWVGGATLPTAFQPWKRSRELGRRAQQPWASKKLCMHHPDPRPTPPAGEPAAGQGRRRGRRARPGPPGFTYHVQLVGDEAGRRLAQEQTEAVAAVLAWLAAHPPVSAAAGSAATGVIGKPSGEKRRCQPGYRRFGSPSSLG
jgi:hypothetical protein